MNLSPILMFLAYSCSGAKHDLLLAPLQHVVYSDVTAVPTHHASPGTMLVATTAWLTRHTVTVPSAAARYRQRIRRRWDALLRPQYNMPKTVPPYTAFYASLVLPPTNGGQACWADAVRRQPVTLGLHS